MSVSDQSAVLRPIRAKYPTPLGTQHAAFLVEAAKATGAKLLRKDAGTNVVLPSGVAVSQDILVFSNGAECFDILSDAEGAAIVTWQPKGQIAGEYVDVGGVVQPPVPPVPPTQPGLSEADVRRIVAEELAKPRNVAIRAFDGQHYLCAENAGGGEVNATRESPGPWEQFTIIPK